MEQVLGVDIRLADAGAGDKKPDGEWTDPATGSRCIVEVTGPTETNLLRSWAEAKRSGRPQHESGCMPVRWGELAQVCSEILAEQWAVENIAKLVAEPAGQRHLFLFARGERYGDYFKRLSDVFEDGVREPVQNLVMPTGIDCVWFRGRAQALSSEARTLNLARFDLAQGGWERHVVSIQESMLPAPAASIADDKRPAGSRDPKRRT